MARVLDSIKQYLKRFKFARKIAIKIVSPAKIKAIKKEGYKTLWEIDSAMQQIGIKYIVDFGTLLGFVREGGFISHDIDVDIGILYANEKEKLKIKTKMESLGFVRSEYFTIDSEIKEESYSKQGVKVDFFYYEKDSISSWCYIFYRIPNKRYDSLETFSAGKYTYDLINEIEYINIKGHLIPVPKNPEKILIEKYGENWRIPEKNWHYWTAPSIEYCDFYGKHHIHNTTNS